MSREFRTDYLPAAESHDWAITEGTAKQPFGKYPFVQIDDSSYNPPLNPVFGAKSLQAIQWLIGFGQHLHHLTSIEEGNFRCRISYVDN